PRLDFTVAWMVDGAGSIDPEPFGLTAVSVQVPAEYRRLTWHGVSLHDHGTGAVGKDHRGIPSRRRNIEAGTLHLSANHQDGAIESRADLGVGQLQAVDEPRALRPDVEGWHRT